MLYEVITDGGRNPLRVVVDSRLRIPGNARLFESLPEIPVLIATTSHANGEKLEQLQADRITSYNVCYTKLLRTQ